MPCHEFFILRLFFFFKLLTIFAKYFSYWPNTTFPGVCLWYFWRMFIAIALEWLFKNKVMVKIWYNEDKITALSFINMHVAVIQSTNSDDRQAFPLTSILPSCMARRDGEQPLFCVIPSPEAYFSDFGPARSSYVHIPSSGLAKCQFS